MFLNHNADLKTVHLALYPRPPEQDKEGKVKASSQKTNNSGYFGKYKKYGQICRLYTFIICIAVFKKAACGRSPSLAAPG